MIHVVSSRRSTCEGAKKLSEKDVDQHQRELAWEEGALKAEARLGGWDVRVGLAGCHSQQGVLIMHLSDDEFIN